MTGIQVMRIDVLDPERIVEEINRNMVRPTSSGMMVHHEFPLTPELFELTAWVDEWRDQTHRRRWTNLYPPSAGPVPPHVHNTWATVIYYPLAHPVPLVVHDDDEELEFFPEPNSCLYMPAGTQHSVLRNHEDNEPRYSVVFLYA